ALRQIVKILFHHSLGCGVACAHSSESRTTVHLLQTTGHLPHGGARICLHGRFCLANQSTGRSITLPAALSAAGTWLSAVDNDDMSALTAETIKACLDLSIKNDPGADACSQSHQDQTLQLFISIVVIFPQGGTVCVISQIHRHI